ncbi:MAG TPA: crosslink repair DNA glycosylase YcaQ family protein [Candidatus Limnocylindrales bacterium]|nr:crosslink repair DNA glycosylase YcaQ family protein [Candidatus Limnocylindrales bacterium]
MAAPAGLAPPSAKAVVAPEAGAAPEAWEAAPGVANERDPASGPRAVSPAVARRFLALHHFLAQPRSLPTGSAGILAVFERLGSIQFDPIEIAGRNHDLVLLARVAGYRREMTDQLLYTERALYETYNKGLSIVPTHELPWYRVAWDRARQQHDGEAFDEHAPLVAELMDRIRTTGPMSSIDIEPRAAIEWSWRPTNQVRALLEGLAEAGILGLSRRDGNRRVYDLIERLFPAEVLAQVVPVRDRFRHKLLSRYRAHGLLGTSGSAELWLGTSPRIDIGMEDGVPLKVAGRRELQRELVADGAILPVVVEGIRGLRYLPATELALLEQAEREIAAGSAPGGERPGVAFLAALDPLVWDREFLRTLYDFDYVWEVYVPAAKRRWGYYVLPILFGDRLVGRIEPRIERKSGTLRIAGLWWEDGFDPVAEPGFVAAFAAAIEAHRAFGGVDRVTWPRATRHRPIVQAVRARSRPGAARRDDPART